MPCVNFDQINRFGYYFGIVEDAKVLQAVGHNRPHELVSARTGGHRHRSMN